MIVERQSRAYCEQRVRAGLLEAPTVELLRRHGWRTGSNRGMAHRGTELRYLGRRFRLDYGEWSARPCTSIPSRSWWPT